MRGQKTVHVGNLVRSDGTVDAGDLSTCISVLGWARFREVYNRELYRGTVAGEYWGDRLKGALKMQDYIAIYCDKHGIA